MVISRVFAVLVCVALAGAGGEPAGATSPVAEGQDALVRGELLFRAHCASCHGSEGRGDGPVAGDLRTRPADLTRLRRPDDKEFPAQRVHQVIDGRFDLAGHGSREMPIWGLTFRERSRDDAQETGVAETIDDLVTYLRSIQADPR